MPEITVIHVALLVLILVVGIVVGWVSRSGRCAKEKTAINVGWQEQLSAQRSEHDRLSSQNKSLMEQISQYQASGSDAKLRARELSAALKDAVERRDELQRQIKDIRGNLEVAIVQRDQLQSDIESHNVSRSAVKKRDEKIFKLSRELESWQERLPPLIERFRIRDEEALQLEADLAEARERINGLESLIGSDQTRVEPVDPDSMADGMDASNESHDASQDGRDVDDSSNATENAGDLAAMDDDSDANGDGEPIDSLIEDFQGTATNELLDDLNDLTNVLVDDPKAERGDEPSDVIANFDANGELRDDLKLIKGVGPSIEKTLNEMGIFRFDQIAEMSEYDIDRVARRLKGFRSRIYREDWIGQARDLQLQKKDERL